MYELSAEGGGNVGLAAFGADPQGLLGEMFCPVAVSGDQRPPSAVHGFHPVQGRIVDLLGHRLHDLAEAVTLADLSRGRQGQCAIVRGPEQQRRVTDVLRPSQGLGREGQQPSEQHRHSKRLGDIVEDADDDGVVPRSHRDRDRFIRETLEAFK